MTTRGPRPPLQPGPKGGRAGARIGLPSPLAGLLLSGMLATYCTGNGPEGCSPDIPPECYGNDDCPKGQRCDLKPFPDAPANQCIDATPWLGNPCDPDVSPLGHCYSAQTCVRDAADAGTGTCQLDCTSDDDCPESFACAITVDGITDFCALVPDGGS